MNILILGSGGREHALAWKIRQSPLCETLYCAPGNAGIERVAQCVRIHADPPYASLIAWCHEKSIGLVVVGPEEPLTLGVVDALAEAGINAFGPSAAAAQIEGSKIFAKDLMLGAGIPTARSRSFTSSHEALTWLGELTPPYVIKADGLAAGKGVTVAQNRDEAEDAIRGALDEARFGNAGNSILIEEFLTGVEASLLAFSDGTTVLAMDSAQDHKPALDGDRGPNTGGMGTVSPTPALTPDIRLRAISEILEPTITALRDREIIYKGLLYAGLMLTPEGPKVIEFNCRFGDPETQVLLPRMEGDLVEVMLACVQGKLDQVNISWSSASCVCVVAASGGYPGPYEKGKPIAGLPPRDSADQIVFHAGTARDAHGQIVTSGGRVLGVTGLGADVREARAKAYAVIEQIRFEGMHYRNDIGLKAMRD